jgi:hypothetical protein
MGIANGVTDGIKLLVLGGRKVRAELSEDQVGVLTIVEERPDYTILAPALTEKKRAIGIPGRYKVDEYDPIDRAANNLTVPWSEVFEFVRVGEEWEVRK